MIVIATTSEVSAICQFSQSGGHHIHKEVCTPFIGEEFCLERKHCYKLFCCHLDERQQYCRSCSTRDTLRVLKVSRKGSIKYEMIGKKKLERGWRCPAYTDLSGSSSTMEQKRQKKALNKSTVSLYFPCINDYYSTLNFI